ncbi:MAG: bifunctional DNA primase/polymerase, partial [Chloroflexota bacterium]
MPDSNLSQTLFTAAEAYLSLGYSVIPIWGEADPARPKVAVVEWAIFQQRRPTPSEIRQWFSDNPFGGIAIITGRISSLAVLDFDTPEGFRDFSAQYPDLVATHVIQTRRGFHIYFHLPPHLQLSSRKGQGVDLLANGRYVIARPTCIDGHTYKLIRGGQPKTLTAFDIERITRFLDELGGAIATQAPEPQVAAFSFDSEPIQSSYREPQKPVITANDLKGLYQGLLAKGLGRNDTLFQVSLKARDEGWTAEQTSASLTDLHVWQPAADHRHETPARRYTEARKTVQSAFSRPARTQKMPAYANQEQIPNSVREHLCKLGQTRTVRVLDGLRLQGITSGMLFTTNQALDLLKGIVGRDSAYAALKSTNSSGQRVFQQHNPSPAPLTPANAATETQTKSNKCFIGREEKPGISPNHRPATVYIMPSNNDLCDCLGVKRSRSDLLTLDDLATAKQTRMALHRELIRRRPGRYPRRWLARRLGVSCETLDIYNRETEGIHFRPCFWEQAIFWSNLNAIPDGIEIAGAFLQDETGKRYPAKQRIAAVLLGQGRHIIYKRQDVNYYWYENGSTLTTWNQGGSQH